MQVVFEWLYKRVAKGLTPVLIDEIFEMMEDEKFVKEIVEATAPLVDAAFDRELARVRSSAGGAISTGGAGSDSIIGTVLQYLLPSIAQKIASGSSGTPFG